MFRPQFTTRQREHLGEAARAVRFMVSDSRAEDWAGELAPVDVVLVMPAERRRDLQEPLFRRVREILRPEGLLLYCGHYDRGGSHEPGAVLRRDELPETLRTAGFRRVDEILDLGGMVLVRATA